MQICDIEDNLQNLKALIDIVSNCDTDVADRLSVQVTLGFAKKELLEIAEKIGYSL